MNLLIIRHGIAEDREGMEDAHRRLTGQGRKRMKQGAKALRKVVTHLDILATSPLLRAVQTGEIVAGQYDGLTPISIAPLSPGKTPMTLLNWLQKQPAEATIALVGHEPGLSIFISWMLTGLQESFVEMKKGGACLLKIEGELRPARAKLQWHLKASQLRDMG
ncbi:MAG TPA: histidine phosphatase family protein [Tepidisphaeraceae bacterium]|jgi:phosphohistidine phosphatase|nr:histidine phosphatase family protein [Tepidisphaeraceae bacterium]